MRVQVPRPENWQDFEDLCLHMWRRIWVDPSAQKNGRRGAEQCGVDVYGRPQCGSQWAGVQCKGKDSYTHKKLTNAELGEEVEKAKKFKPKLSEFFIATTAVRDGAIQEIAREITDKHVSLGLFTVCVCSWEDICDYLEEYPDLKEHYFNKCFPALQHAGSIQAVMSNQQQIIELIKSREPTNALPEVVPQSKALERELIQNREGEISATRVTQENQIGPEKLIRESVATGMDATYLKLRGEGVGQARVKTLCFQIQSYLEEIEYESAYESARLLENEVRQQEESLSEQVRREVYTTLAQVEVQKIRCAKALSSPIEEFKDRAQKFIEKAKNED